MSAPEDRYSIDFNVTGDHVGGFIALEGPTPILWILADTNYQDRLLMAQQVLDVFSTSVCVGGQGNDFAQALGFGAARHPGQPQRRHHREVGVGRLRA